MKRVHRLSMTFSNASHPDSISYSGLQNPLNDVDTENLSMCVIQNIQAYKTLSQAALNQTHQLPCEHANVPLKTLLTGYECSECSEEYSYSFCWKEVIQEGNSWHCEIV